MTPPAPSAVETKARSWAKSIVWRVIGVVILMPRDREEIPELKTPPPPAP